MGGAACSRLSECCTWTCEKRCGRRLHWNVGREKTVEDDCPCCRCCTDPECACCGVRQTRCECCLIPKWIQGCTGLHQILPPDPNSSVPRPLPEIPEPTDGQMAFPLSPERYPIIWIMGGPASGRRTQGRMLAQHYNFHYIRLQALLDGQLPSGAPKLHRLLTLEDKWDLLPTHYMKDVKHEMSKGMYFHEGFIIQGCPYNLADAHKFNKQVGEVSMIIFLEVCVADMRGRAEGYGERPAINRYRTEEGKRQFEWELNQFQTLGAEILKEFKNKVVRLNGEEGSDLTYAQAVESIDFMMRNLGLSPPPHSPKPKPKFKKPDYEKIIDDVKVLALERNPQTGTAGNSSDSIGSLSLPLSGKYNFDIPPPPDSRETHGRQAFADTFFLKTDSGTEDRGSAAKSGFGPQAGGASFESQPDISGQGLFIGTFPGFDGKPTDAVGTGTGSSIPSTTVSSFESAGSSFESNPGSVETVRGYQNQANLSIDTIPLPAYFRPNPNIGKSFGSTTSSSFESAGSSFDSQPGGSSESQRGGSSETARGYKNQDKVSVETMPGFIVTGSNTSQEQAGSSTEHHRAGRVTGRLASQESLETITSKTGFKKKPPKKHTYRSK